MTFVWISANLIYRHVAKCKCAFVQVSQPFMFKDQDYKTFKQRICYNNLLLLSTGIFFTYFRIRARKNGNIPAAKNQNRVLSESSRFSAAFWLCCQTTTQSTSFRFVSSCVGCQDTASTATRNWRRWRTFRWWKRDWRRWKTWRRSWRRRWTVAANSACERWRWRYTNELTSTRESPTKTSLKSCR